MNHDSNQALGKIHQYLKIYEVEPLGRMFVDQLRLSPIMVGSITAFLYFGILIVLHNKAGHPLPVNFQELFSHPSTHYYYPNLIGISFDLIGNPRFFVILVIYRNYIPRQYARLEQDNLITEKPSTTLLERFVRFLGCNRVVQIIAIIVIPIIVSFSVMILSVQVFRPVDVPGKYAIFLTLLGTYAKSVVLIQLLYVFLILNNYTFNPNLNVAHPDQCNGSSPFGNLAIAIYIFLFVWAMFQAIGTSAGGGALEKSLVSTSGSTAYLYVWVLFPITALYVFDRLVYRPHKAISDIRRKYLESSSSSWSSYHKNILVSLWGAVESSKEPMSNKSQLSFDDDLELLETWAKLDNYITETHTWPISKTTFRAMAILVNPLLPMLLPAIISLIKSLLI